MTAIKEAGFDATLIEWKRKPEETFKELFNKILI